MKQKSGGIKQLMELTGKHRGLLTVSRILSGVNSVFVLGSLLCVHLAARELVAIFTETSLDTQGLVCWDTLALTLESIGLLLYFGTPLCSHVVAFHTEKSLKMAVLRYPIKMPMGYPDLNPSGKLRKITDENSSQTKTFIAHQFPDLIGAQVTMVISLILMLAFDWRVGAPLPPLFGIGSFLQDSLMRKDGMKFMQTYQDSLETMNHEAVKYIRGISIVKVFGQMVQSIIEFHNAIKSYRKFALAYTMSCKKGMVASNLVISSSFLVLVPTALITGLVSADLVGFMQSFLFHLIFSPACAVMLSKIMYMTSYKMQVEESMRRINMILTVEPQAEAPVPKHLKIYDVSLENVTFAYENTDHPAVSHLNSTAKAGTTTALVGYSGSGKSITASPIPRFYDVQEEAVKVGGVDTREIAHADLMKMMTFVLQSPRLFKGSLLESVRVGRPTATREEVLRAAHMAQRDDILEKLLDGIDTAVGSKGVYLSGGETQRIVIARVILKDASIVVLDEATAYTDPENEQQIRQTFEGLVAGKTVIMIAHRLSTAQDANLTLVMKNDEPTESGVYDALVQQNGEYARMWVNYTKTTKWHIRSEVKVR